MEVAHDDLDEDIERLQIVLQDEDGHESEGELIEMERHDEEFISNPSRPSTSSDFTASSFPTASVCTDGDELTSRFDPNTITAETCLAMNRAYQEVLLDTLRQIEMSLFENRACQNQLEDSINDKSSNKRMPTTETQFSFPCISKALPFFRDENGDLPPPNPDVKLKESMNEDKQQIRPKVGWSKIQRKTLLDAVKLDALEQLIRPALNKVELEMEKLQQCKTTEEINECKDRIKALKQDVNIKQITPADELLKTVDSSKIDFLKIAALNFDCKFHAFECESMWKNVLHPGINRDKWTPEEDEHLKELVKTHQMRNWQQIAAELGTNRTPYQCLQHFQYNNIIHDDSEWREEEDQMLKEIIDSFACGKSKIQWYQVAYYMDNRSASQCRSRWSQIDPYRKIGRWSEQEDYKLLNAVRKTGMVFDWNKVAELVPNRTAMQCRERYMNRLRDMPGGRTWTYEEDKQLLLLHQQYGNNWDRVSGHLYRRPDLSVQSRYKRLMRWKDEMEQFESYPTEVQETKMHEAFEFGDNGKVKIKPGLVKNRGAHMYGRPLGSKKTTVRKPEGERLREEAGVPNSDDEDETVAAESSNVTTETTENSDVTMETTTTKKEKQCKMSCKEKNKIQNDLDIFIGYYNIDGNDYRRQLDDFIAGNIVVPRPVPLKNFKEKKMPSLWKKRTALMEVVQTQIDSYLNRIQSGALENTGPGVQNNLYDEICKRIKMDEGTEEEKRKLIFSAFGGKNPCELKVKELLNISRGIKENAVLPEVIKEEEEETWIAADSSDDDEKKDDDDDDEDDVDDDMFAGEGDNVEEIEKKPLTDAQKQTIETLHYKNSMHHDVNANLRTIVELSMDYSEFRNPGRRKKYCIYPNNVAMKYKGMVEDVKLNKTSTTLLLKAFDVDSKNAYIQAYKGIRKLNAMAMVKTAEKKSNLKRAKTRRQKVEIIEESQKEANITTEFREAASYILDVGDELGISEEEIESIDENDDHFAETSKASTPTGTEEKSLPYLPPNKTTLQGMKGLLTEHRRLIDQAEKYFNPEELREKLYNLKEKGPNAFMGVLNAVGKAEVACRKLKGRQNPRKVYQVTATEEECSQQLKEARKSAAYQQLKARFLSMFSWPALLSTIQPPKSLDLPKSLRNLAIKSSLEHLNKFYSRVKKNKSGSILDRLKIDNDDNDDDDRTLVAPDENLTEEEAIEKLVETIMSEYEENRVYKGGYRKKNRDKYLKKERTEILKKLGLFEKMQEFKRQREESSTVTTETRPVKSKPLATTPIATKPIETRPIDVDNSEIQDILLPTIGPGVKDKDEDTVNIKDDSTVSEESPVVPIKRGKGRPKGAKTKITQLDESEKRKSTRVKVPRKDEDIIISPVKKKTTQSSKYGNYSHLRELIPKKLNNVISQISDIPLLNEPQTSSEPVEKVVKKVVKKKSTNTKIQKKRCEGTQKQKSVDMKRKIEVIKKVNNQSIYAKKRKLENMIYTHSAAWDRDQKEKLENENKQIEEDVRDRLKHEILMEYEENGFDDEIDDDDDGEINKDEEIDDNHEITFEVIDNKGTLVQVKNDKRSVTMGTKDLQGAEALVALAQNTVDNGTVSSAMDTGKIHPSGEIRGGNSTKVNVQGANNVNTAEDVTDNSKEEPMFIGVPIFRGGATQMACIPFRPDKDGKITLPDGRQVDTSVHKEKSYVSINVATSEGKNS
ncbi:Myblike DNAbinding domain-containing protein [Mactra antiquata]